MAAPVIVFAYNRLEHMRVLLQQLEENEMASETDVYIFSDGPKGTDSSVEAVRAYLRDYSRETTAFRKVEVFFAERNRGLATSVISGVNRIFEEYDRVIVLEDDLHISHMFLKYMNRALDFYRNKQEIWSISGYSFPMKTMFCYPHDVFYSYRGCSWGWATWKDRFQSVDWNVSTYDTFLKDKKIQKRFNRGGKDLTPMLIRQMNHEIDSWAVRWCYEQSRQNKYTVYPVHTLVENAGRDGSGTNCGVDYSKNRALDYRERMITFEYLKINHLLRIEFARHYEDTLDKKIKRRLRKLMRGQHV